MHYLFLAAAIVAEVIATSALKASAGFTRPGPSLLVVLGYGVSFYCLTFVLKAMPVGIAYAIWSGAGVTLVTLAGWLFFQQRLDAPAMAGITLIVVGVVILNVFSRTTIH